MADILDLPESVHTLLLGLIPPKTRLLTLPLVCKLFLGLVEEDCQLLCAQHGWRAARRPRGVCAAESSSPFRRLYLNHSCACCYAVGDFCARMSSSSHPRFLLCGPCARSEAGRARLVPLDLMLDLTGLSGKALYTARGDRFCAALHAESEKWLGRESMLVDTSCAMAKARKKRRANERR